MTCTRTDVNAQSVRAAIFRRLLQQHAYCIIILFVYIVRCAPGDRKSRSTATRDPSLVCPSFARILQQHLHGIYGSPCVRVRLPLQCVAGNGQAALYSGWWVASVRVLARAFSRTRVWRVPCRLFVVIDRCRAALARAAELLPRRSIVTAVSRSRTLFGSRTSLRVAAVGRTFATAAAADGAFNTRQTRGALPACCDVSV